MRSPSASRSMWSHTQPQKVQVAFCTVMGAIVSLGCLSGLSSARTGRSDERSAERPAAEAAADPARHVPADLGVDQLPGLDLLDLGRIEPLRELGPLDCTHFWMGLLQTHDLLHSVELFSHTGGLRSPRRPGTARSPARPRPPSPWTSASRFHRSSGP